MKKSALTKKLSRKLTWFLAQPGHWHDEVYCAEHRPAQAVPLRVQPEDK